MLAVSCSECVVYINIGIACKSLCKLLLASLHLLLGCIVSRISLIDTYRLTLLLGIVTKVLKQKHFTRLQGSGSISSLCTIGSKLNGSAKLLSDCIGNLSERHFGVHFALRLTHVRHDDESATISKNLLESRESTTNTGVIGNFAVFVQWNIEVNTNNGFLASEIVIIYVLHINKKL